MEKTPLHQAILQGDTTLLRAHILLDPALISVQDENGLTPILLAGITGNREMVNLLIHFGADPQQKSGEGLTAEQHLAVFHKNASHATEFRYLNTVYEMVRLESASKQAAKQSKP